jgi:hypothetical protein
MNRRRQVQGIQPLIKAVKATSTSLAEFLFVQPLGWNEILHGALSL